MSEADKLLESLTSDGTGSGSGDSEEHIVIGRDRVISVPDSLKNIAVQFDHNIETVTFDCPRKWDNHDMLEDDGVTIYINYLLPDGNVASAVATNLKDDANPDIMHFDWTISRNATSQVGHISFLVCVRRVDGEGNVLYDWNSELNTEMFISSGLPIEEHLEELNSDVITHLLLRMDELEAIGLSHVVDVETVSDGYNITFKDISTATPKTINIKHGGIFTPVVSEQGDISWTNNRGLPNPQTVNIRGARYIPSVDDEGNISWTNDKNLPNPETKNIMGPIGAVTETLELVDGSAEVEFSKRYRITSDYVEEKSYELTEETITDSFKNFIDEHILKYSSSSSNKQPGFTTLGNVVYKVYTEDVRLDNSLNKTPCLRISIFNTSTNEQTTLDEKLALNKSDFSSLDSSYDSASSYCALPVAVGTKIYIFLGKHYTAYPPSGLYDEDYRGIYMNRLDRIVIFDTVNKTFTYSNVKHQPSSENEYRYITNLISKDNYIYVFTINNCDINVETKRYNYLYKYNITDDTLQFASNEYVIGFLDDHQPLRIKMVQYKSNIYAFETKTKGDPNYPDMSEYNSKIYKYDLTTRTLTKKLREYLHNTYRIITAIFNVNTTVYIIGENITGTDLKREAYQIGDVSCNLALKSNSKDYKLFMDFYDESHGCFDFELLSIKVNNDKTQATVRYILNGEHREYVFYGENIDLTGCKAYIENVTKLQRYVTEDGIVAPVELDIDSELSETSENPVQNKVITKALNDIDMPLESGEGLYSVVTKEAEGRENIAAGRASFAGGHKTKAYQRDTFAYGGSNVGGDPNGNQDDYSFSFVAGGSSNKATGWGAFVGGGQNNDIGGKCSGAVGYTVKISAEYSQGIGDIITINSDDSIKKEGWSQGLGRRIKITNDFVQAIGQNIDAYALNALPIGNYLKVNKTAENTQMFGRYLQSDTPNQQILGHHNLRDPYALFILGNGEETSNWTETSVRDNGDISFHHRNAITVKTNGAFHTESRVNDTNLPVVEYYTENGEVKNRIVEGQYNKDIFHIRNLSFGDKSVDFAIDKDGNFVFKTLNHDSTNGLGNGYTFKQINIDQFGRVVLENTVTIEDENPVVLDIKNYGSPVSQLKLKANGQVISRHLTQDVDEDGTLVTKDFVVRKVQNITNAAFHKVFDAQNNEVNFTLDGKRYYAFFVNCQKGKFPYCGQALMGLTLVMDGSGNGDFIGTSAHIAIDGVEAAIRISATPTSADGKTYTVRIYENLKSGEESQLSIISASVLCTG